MDKLPLFEQYNNDLLAKEAYTILEGKVPQEDLDLILNEGLFGFIKGIFLNPFKKRKLKQLGEELFKVKVEMNKIQIEEDAMNSFKADLDTMKRGTKEYETQESKIEVSDKAKQMKIDALASKEETIIAQIDSIGSENETLQRYVDKIKLEIRIKANDATIRMADGEMQRILKQLKGADLKQANSLEREIKKAS
jgi:hypothetical protein